MLFAILTIELTEVQTVNYWTLLKYGIINLWIVAILMTEFEEQHQLLDT